MKKQLIINADDFGLEKEANGKIISCYRLGALSDISILAAGDAFDHAAHLARKNAIEKIGIHLALTGGFRSLTQPERVPSLVDRSGRFQKGYGGFLSRFFSGRIKKDEIYTEFKNQIARVKKENFKITHVDSHQHIHTVPSILKIVIKLMKEEHIDRIRFPVEKLSIFDKIKNPFEGARNLLLSSMCGLSKGILKEAGVKHNSYFIGHARALKLGKNDLISAILNLRDGITELGCHPGNSEKELKAISSPDFINEIKTRSISLVSWDGSGRC